MNNYSRLQIKDFSDLVIGKTYELELTFENVLSKNIGILTKVNDEGGLIELILATCVYKDANKKVIKILQNTEDLPLGIMRFTFDRFVIYQIEKV